MGSSAILMRLISVWVWLQAPSAWADGHSCMVTQQMLTLGSERSVWVSWHTKANCTSLLVYGKAESLSDAATIMSVTGEAAATYNHTTKSSWHTYPEYQSNWIHQVRSSGVQHERTRTPTTAPHPRSPLSLSHTHTHNVHAHPTSRALTSPPNGCMHACMVYYCHLMHAWSTTVI